MRLKTPDRIRYKAGINYTAYIERTRPCICRHIGDQHWHDWLTGVRTTGDFKCHAFACECLAYEEMDNLDYLEWKYKREWYRRLFRKIYDKFNTAI